MGSSRIADCLNMNMTETGIVGAAQGTKKKAVKAQMQLVVGDLENVLGELQTVMGDIKTLVGHIDEITTRIDERCADNGIRRHSASVLDKTPQKLAPLTNIRHSISHSNDLTGQLSDYDRNKSICDQNANDSTTMHADDLSVKSQQSTKSKSSASSQFTSPNTSFLVVPYSGDRQCVMRRNSDICHDRKNIASALPFRNTSCSVTTNTRPLSCYSSRETVDSTSQLNIRNNNNMLNNNYVSEQSINSLVYTPCTGYDPWLKLSVNNDSIFSSQSENAKVVKKRKQHNSSKRSSHAYSITPSTSTTASTTSAPPLDINRADSSASVDVDYSGVYERELEEKLEMEPSDEAELSDIPDTASDYDTFRSFSRSQSKQLNSSVSMTTISSDTESEFGSDSMRTSYPPRRLNPLIKYTWRTVIEP